ncbi:MAG: transposase [Candidatus Moranbacteria bacterium CG23_combo_of_CG06-09_8_20_14_all_39_10]|nr:IS1634 family transposase [bacterium]PIP26914.1 MAG: transposase [Candidatus Moranbacteria bacterium CG23_combo_of_CG06-09_8_20_14_all_39_10]
MYHIRKTKTASGATAVQVVNYIERKITLAKHIGSGRTNEEIAALLKIAETWIKKISRQQGLFDKDENQKSNLALLDKCEYIGFRYNFIYEILIKLLDRFEFTAIGNALLHDLVIMRIIQPASKLQSLELLKEYFGISHRRQTFYETLPKLLPLKDTIEKLTVKLAKTELAFDFSLVFYDVTTLYFESFSADELRKNGFSKDSKSQQPQIVIGLMVTAQGFPIAYEVFPGNKFEGHTLIPVVKSFKDKHQITTLTVVADAGMISMENVTALKESGLQYIVGARLGNITPKTLASISGTLSRRSGATTRLTTLYGDLICDFSEKRYAKDKREMEKQIKKAEELLKNPKETKRTKFIKNIDKTTYEMNNALIEKTKLLLGIKGYYTNLDSSVSDQTIISHYHNLWHVEQAFRVAKNDLETRPIFHFKEDAIKVHMLICFMALAVSKYMEIQTDKSLQHIIRTLKQVTDARLLNTLNGEEIIMRAKISGEAKNILEKIGLSY